jgi:hypothetical protein
MQDSLTQAYNQKYSDDDKKRPTKPDVDFKAPADIAIISIISPISLMRSDPANP